MVGSWGSLGMGGGVCQEVVEWIEGLVKWEDCLGSGGWGLHPTCLDLVCEALVLVNLLLH